MSEVIISTKGIVQKFGGLCAVNNVSLEIRKGEIVSIIGPNGAGKTTLFNVITGLNNPTAGKVLYHEKEITGMKPFRITALGLARTFQNIRLFNEMTVMENVMVGMHCRYKSNLFDAFFKTPRHRREEIVIEEKAADYLEIASLADYRYEYATSLPYGLQRRLEIARALASEPEVLLLDEPAAGMNEHETESLMEFIRELQGMGYTILLIEHDMRFVMNVCERIYVLNQGSLIAEGVPSEIKANPDVIEAYLGKEAYVE